ncbi:MAG TPA: zf-TFIIB domain-containing protein [Gemmatimonadales bacterium]|nr:zf-TFIIB domain-containing protein [Gemmatimonadales bacterium]
MADLKPTQSEEEYFHRLEQERLARRRAEAAAQQAAREKDERRALHYMKCPKCGADLVTENYKSIQVDRCTECRGVWFDAGEVESLVETGGGALQGFFSDLFKGFGGKRK